MNRRRRVAVVTGTRAEYGLLRSTLAALDAQPTTHLQLIVTGMHLLRKFGHTVADIVADGWNIDARVKMQRGDDDALDQAVGLSRGVAGIARYLESARTDIVVVLGDRIEGMAGALAAVTTGRMLAHIHGGDMAPGDIDDDLRHAITKLAHLHLPATFAARRRIIGMGEAPDQVHCVGAPGLDRLAELMSDHPKRRGRTGRALIVQHPCGRSAAREAKTMKMILSTVEAAGLAMTILYPNSDRGHSGIIRAIEDHDARSHTPVQLIRSLDRDQYLLLLMESDLLIGNSSSGIIESCFAGTAVVNVGDRQRGRERGGRAVVDADENPDGMAEALRRAMRKRPIRGCQTVYGDGRAGERIARMLASTPLAQH